MFCVTCFVSGVVVLILMWLVLRLLFGFLCVFLLCLCCVLSFMVDLSGMFVFCVSAMCGLVLVVSVCGAWFGLGFGFLGFGLFWFCGLCSGAFGCGFGCCA